jgi:ribonucleoside-diphosphate reductase alpha chain
MVTLTNFNISVAVDEAFLHAVETDDEYDLINPRTGAVVGRRRARAVFDMIVANAGRNGDPGLVFLDRINAANPTPAIGLIEATNRCGEQPLLPYESCNLGSLNLSRFLKPSAAGAPEIDWDALADVIRLAVRFLDDVIDMNAYPVEAIDRQTKLTRKIGLGVMGWADLLFELGIAYDSEEALALAERLMAFISEQADAASADLAQERGPFPAWEESIYGPKRAHTLSPPAETVRPLRNSTRTTIAPTGTLSIIADCTGGIEPAFALAFTRQHFLDPKNPTEPVRMTEVNPVFERIAREQGFYSQELVDYLAAGHSLQDRHDVPVEVRRRFVTAHEISPSWHVRMQAAFQRHTDNAVSKTINFPRQATIGDVAEAYMLAYREGCKGITIYRDGSRTGQVLSHVAEGEGVPTVAEHPDVAYAAGSTPIEARGEGLALTAPSSGATRARRRNGATSRRRQRYQPPRPALPFSEIATVAPCPDCSNSLVFAEGCLSCRSCGYTRCG